MAIFQVLAQVLRDHEIYISRYRHIFPLSFFHLAFLSSNQFLSEGHFDIPFRDTHTKFLGMHVLFTLYKFIGRMQANLLKISFFSSLAGLIFCFNARMLLRVKSVNQASFYDMFSTCFRNYERFQIDFYLYSFSQQCNNY